MKIILILIFVVVGIPVLKAMIEAVSKTKETSTLEHRVLNEFLKAVNESGDEMNLEFNENISIILGLNEKKTFKLIGKIINGEDITGYYKKRYEQYFVKSYIDTIVNVLESYNKFKSIKKHEKKDILKATESGEIRDYKYKYSVEKWTIDTNTSFYITLSTFTKENVSCFAFAMTEY